MHSIESLVELHRSTGYDLRAFETELIKLKFKNLTPDRHNVSVYSKKSLDFVVKVATSVLDAVPRKNHILSPYYLYPIYDNRGVRIQHKAKLHKRKRAYEQIQYRLGVPDIELQFYDVGSWNVGWRDNKAVIFDCNP